MPLIELLKSRTLQNVRLIATCLAVIIVLGGIVKYNNAIDQLNAYSIELERAKAENLARNKQLNDMNKQITLVNQVASELRLANEQQHKVSRQIIVKHVNDKDDYMSEALINILNEVNDRHGEEDSN